VIGCWWWPQNLPLLKLGGGEVAVDAKGPPVLVSWDGMVLENLLLLETGRGEVERPTGARFIEWW
jgi:hypothetical protein